LSEKQSIDGAGEAGQDPAGIGVEYALQQRRVDGAEVETGLEIAVVEVGQAGLGAEEPTSYAAASRVVKAVSAWSSSVSSRCWVPRSLAWVSKPPSEVE
jgi:hypothetical protein